MMKGLESAGVARSIEVMFMDRSVYDRTLCIRWMLIRYKDECIWKACLLLSRENVHGRSRGENSYPSRRF